MTKLKKLEFLEIIKGILFNPKEFIPLIAKKSINESINLWLVPLILIFGFYSIAVFLSPSIAYDNPFASNSIILFLVNLFGFFISNYIISVLINFVAKLFGEKDSKEKIFSVLIAIETIAIIIIYPLNALVKGFVWSPLLDLGFIVIIGLPLGIYRIYLEIKGISLIYKIDLFKALTILVLTYVLGAVLLVILAMFSLPLIGGIFPWN